MSKADRLVTACLFLGLMWGIPILHGSYMILCCLVCVPNLEKNKLKQLKQDCMFFNIVEQFSRESNEHWC